MKKIILTLIISGMAFLSADAQLYPDRHTTSPSDGWLSCTAAASPNTENTPGHWILFDLQTPQTISTVKLWNHNDPTSLSNGIQLLKIEYSLDGVTWNNGGAHNVDQSLGSAFYEGQDIADLNGASMRYILITAESNYGGSCYGIAETRFYIGAPVPVELASFEGVCENGVRDLKWTFADVKDFASVDVEWSTDGKKWSNIYTTTNSGTSISGGMYESDYSDTRKMNSDANFYRLRINDIDGDFEYSNIVEANCEIDENDIRIFPNPVRKEMSIDMDLLDENSVDYILRDILGKTLLSGTFEASAGVNRFTLNTTSLPGGTYFISLDFGNKILEKKILKIE